MAAAERAEICEKLFVKFFTHRTECEWGWKIWAFSEPLVKITAPGKIFKGNILNYDTVEWRWNIYFSFWGLVNGIIPILW